MWLTDLQQRLNLRRFFLGSAPQAAPYIVTRSNLYILPTRQGLFFAITLMVMLLGAINYSNSLGYLLTFLLASVGVVTMLHTYRNLLHLQLRIAPIAPAFVHQDVVVPVQLSNPEAARVAVTLEFPDHDNPVYVDLGAQQTHTVRLRTPALRRGEHALGRIVLSCTYPLGLFRAWSPVVLDARYLCYPAPAKNAGLPQTSLYIASLSGDQGVGADDFAGLRNYHPGDSLKHVHWKALARQQLMLTKQFGGDRSDQLWLDWRMLEGLDDEARLSHLCRWVIEAEQQACDYGLWLPQRVIEPARGPAHRHECLKALALHGQARGGNPG